MTKANNNVIGMKLRKCRTNCSLSQQQVADSIGTERSTYTCYENGRFEPSLETIVKLSKIFCVDVTELLPYETDPNNLSEPDSTDVNPIYSLTKDEQSLLLAYRLLSEDKKAEILANITNITNNAT